MTDEYIKNDDAFMTAEKRTQISIPTALELFAKFDPEVERYTREITKPNPGDVFYFYDADKIYNNDYKVDGFQWIGNGENKKYPEDNPQLLRTYDNAKTWNAATKAYEVTNQAINFEADQKSDWSSKSKQAVHAKFSRA
jgi:hypothetical protein